MATNQKPVNQAKAVKPVIEKEEVEAVKAEIKKPELSEVLEYLKLSSDMLKEISQERRKAGLSDIRTGNAYRELNELIKRLSGL